MIITINPLLNVMFRLFLFIILFSISAFSEQTPTPTPQHTPTPTPTPIEVMYFEIDTSLVAGAYITFESSAAPMPYTLDMISNTDNTYVLIEVFSNTTDGAVVFEKLGEKAPVIKNLKKIKNIDFDNRSIDVDYNFVKNGVPK